MNNEIQVKTNHEYRIKGYTRVMNNWAYKDRELPGPKVKWLHFSPSPPLVILSVPLMDYDLDVF